MRVLLLGIGNLLLSDEAIGVRVIEAFEKRFDVPDFVEIMDGGTAGMELMEAMANRDHLIIVDAVLASEPAGSIIVLRDEEVPALFTKKISPHQLGLSDVLSALHLTDEFPERLTLIGVIPESLEPHIGLTPTVEKSLELALNNVVLTLQEDNIPVTAKVN
jgi:hydrogenase maturation protease